MHTLPPPIAREAHARLCASLPPPEPDMPETRAARDRDAMQAVADLRPATAYEARLAVEIVAADACALDCLRLAMQFRNDIAVTLRCRAQANAMMRQVKSTRLLLEREQASRQKAQAPAADDGVPARPPAAPPPDAVLAAGSCAIRQTDAAARSRTDDRPLLPVMTRLDPSLARPDPAVVNGATAVLREPATVAREPAEAA